MRADPAPSASSAAGRPVVDPTIDRGAPPLARLWRYAAERRYRGRALGAAGLSILNKLFDLAPPFLIGVAVDVVVVRETSMLARLVGLTDPTAQITLLAAVTFAVWALESASEYAFQVLWRNLAQDVQHDLRLEAFDHVQHLDLAFYEERDTAGLMAVLNDDVNQLERFLDVGATEILHLTTTVVVLGAFFFAAAPEVAWWAFLPMPVIVWGSLRFQARMAPRYAAVREQVGLLNAQLANALGGIATVKSFTAEAQERDRLGALSRGYVERNAKAIALSSAFVPLIRIAIVVGFMATLVYGGRQALAGELSVGLYSTLVFMTQRLLWPLTRLGQTLDLYQRAMASTRRVFGLLDTEPVLRDGPTPLPVAQVAGEVRFDGVRFAYATGDVVLHGIDLHVPAGRTLAIVGPTGAGKSSIVKLLLRLYDPTSGSVTLDGVDLRERPQADVRRAVGLVSQDVFLFHGSVRANLRYGGPDADEAALWRALELAEARPFVEALPQGLDTVVGERGQKLSGGQRQRLALARAILKDPPVLVLDEATSAVDNETEAAIQRSLASVTQGRTTVAIAHRLSTIRHADEIVVLDQGRVAERGRHDELVAADGIYAGLWRVQTGERIGREAPALAGRR
ncbi:MAG: ABC transporter ATP-binding protein [Trueperaceae bacterium]